MYKSVTPLGSTNELLFSGQEDESDQKNRFPGGVQKLVLGELVVAGLLVAVVVGDVSATVVT